MLIAYAALSGLVIRHDLALYVVRNEPGEIVRYIHFVRRRVVLSTYTASSAFRRRATQTDLQRG